MATGDSRLISAAETLPASEGHEKLESRVLRVPGSLNWKTAPPIRSGIVFAARGAV
jgi:hypothetical protein